MGTAFGTNLGSHFGGANAPPGISGTNFLPNGVLGNSGGIFGDINSLNGTYLHPLVGPD